MMGDGIVGCLVCFLAQEPNDHQPRGELGGDGRWSIVVASEDTRTMD